MIKIICEINVLLDFVLIDFNELVKVLFHRSGKEKYSCVGISIVSLWSCIIGNCCLNHRLRPILFREKFVSNIWKSWTVIVHNETSWKTKEKNCGEMKFRQSCKSDWVTQSCEKEQTSAQLVIHAEIRVERVKLSEKWTWWFALNSFCLPRRPISRFSRKWVKYC